MLGTIFYFISKFKGEISNKILLKPTCNVNKKKCEGKHILQRLKLL